MPPGGGPPPHIHRREEETFYVQQGTLTVQVGDKTLQASPGDCVYLPRGIAHCFKNTGDIDAKFMVVVTPAGLENFFAGAFRPAADDSAPPLMIDEAPDVEKLWDASIHAAREAGFLVSGDRVVITAGTAVNIPGSTNVIKVDIA